MGPLGESSSRWGDPQLLVQRLLSPTAIWAVAISATAPVITVVCEMLPSGAFQNAIFGPTLLLLAFLLRLAAVPLGMGFSYAVLLSLRRDGDYCGRGLAWAGLLLSYTSVLWFASLLANAFPNGMYYVFGVLAVACIHVPAFAAECAAARCAVVSLLIATPLLSLLSCGLLESREQARRLQCAKILKEYGRSLSERQAVGNPSPLALPPLKAEDVQMKRTWAPAE